MLSTTTTKQTNFFSHRENKTYEQKAKEFLTSTSHITQQNKIVYKNGTIVQK